MQQVPLTQVWPEEHAQVPPQPSEPQLPGAHVGVQQDPLTQVWPEVHEQVPPQPSVPHDPLGQLGVQHDWGPCTEVQIS